MFTISIIISIVVAVFLALFGLVLHKNVLKQPQGSKKLIDNVKIALFETKKALGKQNSAISIVTGPVFVLILYFLNWITALGFLIGVLATIVINLILTNIVAQNSGKVVESSRKGLKVGANMALKTGTITALFSSGLALLVTAGFYAIFKDIASLIGLGVGVSLTTLVLRLLVKKDEESKVNTNLPIGFFELVILSIIITMFLGREIFKNSDNPTLFPIILTSLSAVVFAVSSIFMRFFKNSKRLAIVIYRTLTIETVLFVVGGYFIYVWLMKETGINSMINYYGLAILSLIILFLSGMAILINIYNQIVKASTLVAKNCEMPEDVKNHLKNMASYEKISGKILKLYSIKGTTFISIAIFAGFILKLQKTGTTNVFDYRNYLVFVGLFIGMLLISLFYFQKIKFKESINKSILVCAVIILIPVIIGMTLGSTALTGYVIGILLTGLLASIFFCQSFANVVRVTSIIALLFAIYMV